ncbi:MAG: PAS domain-containing protein [Chloroflexi bacterium]|nr:PAS domain-containing protein [Chloroflexota bacterium]
MDPADAVAAHKAAADVISGWMTYQDLSGSFGSDAVLVADAHGVFVAANDAASELVGRAMADLIGRTVADITAQGRAGLVDAMWQEFLERGSMSGRYDLQTPSGTVTVTYQARAHQPIPGYFSSRLCPAQPTGAGTEAAT